MQIDQNRNERRPGLMQRVALEASARYAARFRLMDGAAALDPAEAVMAALEAALPSWTVEVPDSAGDVDPFDANANPDDPPDLRAQDKRAILPARFTTEALMALAAPRPAAPEAIPSAAAAVVPGTAPAPIPALSGPVPSHWFLSVRKTLLGPYDLAQLRALAAEGRLQEGTNVRPGPAGAWTRVRDVPVLLDLLHPEDLPDDEDDPAALPDDE